MRCKNFYRYANLLAVILLLLSTGLNFGVKAITKSSTPDTFPHPEQAQTLDKTTNLAQKPIQSTTITPKTPAPASTTRATSAPLTITLAGRTHAIFTTSALATNPGSAVALYQGQFLFAHSTSAFAALPGATTFQINRGGTTESYQIIKKVVYCDYSNASQHGPGYACSNYPEPALPARALGSPTDYYEAHVSGYDFILMTCAGQSLPGGDATHRLLAYAIRI